MTSILYTETRPDHNRQHQLYLVHPIHDKFVLLNKNADLYNHKTIAYIPLFFLQDARHIYRERYLFYLD
ncbi:hypothetical protein [Chlorobium phaeobacteroides]|uniref:hypothetical protein n=1 Tax=Chlorobium phaeobacteroides TaxID=1096 RepID=UPI0012329FA7|nr:hypothetical protein [Chlorobium phaeobacteroides]